jgi:hypothetical protein
MISPISAVRNWAAAAAMRLHEVTEQQIDPDGIANVGCVTRAPQQHQPTAGVLGQGDP